MADRMGWLCEDCFAWAATEEQAGWHSDEWQHSLAVCPESRRGLRMWTLYQHPSDFEEPFVVRPSRVVKLREGEEPRAIPAPRAWPFNDLGEAHRFLLDLPDGLVRIQGPGEDSDPAILEVWV